MTSRDYYRDLSRRLSRVMDNIGVYREAVIILRTNGLMLEHINTLDYHLCRENCTTYIFGSQTEGTTTAGQHPDVDTLIVYEDYNLIQNKENWVPGKNNLMMIQDKRFPGYCKLECLKADGPHPEIKIPHVEYTFDGADRVWLTHNFPDVEERHDPAVFRHGPAIYYNDGSGPWDFVYAIRCKTWPYGYRMWSTQSKKITWPTPEMISYMEKSGCFVVPVAHCLDEKKSESWRISTSLAERCLMFSLNITQIRCCMLIKMIVKTFIDPVKPKVISSYICKNLLFHCIENTKPDFWQESNLLRCVNQVLLNMLEAIRCMNCPNYFNNSINLLLGKVNEDNQVALMGVIWKVLVSEGGFLAEIRYDKIDELMHSYRETGYQGNDFNRDKEIKRQLQDMNANVVSYCSDIIKGHMLSGTFNQQSLTSIQETLLLFSLQGPHQYVTATLLFPFLCSHLATLRACEHIKCAKKVCESVLKFLSLPSRTSQLYEISRESDAASSSLRYASYFYCAGQFEKAMLVLYEVEDRVLAGIDTACRCDVKSPYCTTILKHSYHYASIYCGAPIQCIVPMRVSTCVMFSQAERRCCPRELQYEMYRSTEQEKLQRDKGGSDDWMDLACIESYNYLAFLFYMTSRHIGYRDLQLLALEQLKKYTRKDMGHRETVYNLLGQCYEYENLFDEAFACYCKSLRVRPTNNAARWHIVLLLNTVYQDQNE